MPWLATKQACVRPREEVALERDTLDLHPRGGLIPCQVQLSELKSLSCQEAVRLTSDSARAAPTAPGSPPEPGRSALH